MKKITVRSKTVDYANGTSVTESERTETHEGNGLFEAWGALILFFLTFVFCVVIVRSLVVPSQPKQQNLIEDINPSNT